jgi:hypothetical protein
LRWEYPRCRSREGGNPVIASEANLMQAGVYWMPAFAGMTNMVRRQSA